jgi:hypothetical protein
MGAKLANVKVSYPKIPDNWSKALRWEINWSLKSAMRHMMRALRL